jgi:hypothetical protein
MPLNARRFDCDTEKDYRVDGVKRNTPSKIKVGKRSGAEKLTSAPLGNE